MDRPSEAAVRDSLYNWLGFGNPNGKYWFIGREESITLSKCGNVDSWEEYFQKRAEFDLTTDLRETWEETFGRQLTTFGTTTWHYQIAFLLAFHGRTISSARIKNILANDPQFARPFSNHFSGEFFPCPKSSKDTIAPYGHIWDSVQDYHEDIADNRLEMFSNALQRNRDVDWIITYSPGFATHLRAEHAIEERHRWEDLAMDPIVLSEIQLESNRTVNLVETPFLGYGRIGYDAIETVVEELEHFD